MQIIKPTSCLSPFVKAFLIVESDEGLVNRLLPDTAVVMAFRYKGAVSLVNGQGNAVLPAFSVSGIRKTSKLVQYSAGSGNILVQFCEGAAAAFFPFPVHELFEASVSLDHLFGASRVEQLEEEVYFAATLADKIRLIEQFLISKLPLKQPDELISSAIQKIQTADGMLRIKQLAESLYISHDAFEKRFRKTVGTSPKQFAAIIRMKFMISQGLLSKPLAEAALDAGFFDQSHFIREFRKFAGETPRVFFGLGAAGL